MRKANKGELDILTTQANNKGVIKGSSFDSCIKLIIDTADLPHYSTVIIIVERWKREIGRNKTLKKVFMN